MNALSLPGLIHTIAYRVKRAHAMRLIRASATIGANTTINPWANIGDAGFVTIGSECVISSAQFLTHSGFDRIASRTLGRPIDTRRPIVVGNRCFIGDGAKILAGVTIGDDCIVSAGAVVRRDVLAGSVVAGNPAVVIDTTAAYLERLAARFPLQGEPA